MMKNIIRFCSIILILSACNNAEDLTESKDAVINKHIDTVQEKIATVLNSQINQDTSLANRILGIWALIGQDNASFDIQKNKIYYPEYSKSYKYQMKKNSLTIKYDDYIDSFLVETKGSDTLILIAEDEKQVYYRFKR
ncbi:MAG: hypothetical protein KGZ59_00525 [Chitinophagaceae bacterium]|nr:hypothetical protein [Chitinophagaceae bacterium]